MNFEEAVTLLYDYATSEGNDGSANAPTQEKGLLPSREKRTSLS